jgi:hypothetical protein
MVMGIEQGAEEGQSLEKMLFPHPNAETFKRWHRTATGRSQFPGDGEPTFT